jgi:hypothetical protein
MEWHHIVSIFRLLWICVQRRCQHGKKMISLWSLFGLAEPAHSTAQSQRPKEAISPNMVATAAI